MTNELLSNLRPDDRVLLLSVPPAEELTALVRAVHDGLLVGIAPAGALEAARQQVLDFPNAMFAPEDPEGGIPWADGFFTTVYAPHLESPTDEIKRVLDADGVVHLSASRFVKTA